MIFPHQVKLNRSEPRAVRIISGLLSPDTASCAQSCLCSCVCSSVMTLFLCFRAGSFGSWLCGKMELMGNLRLSVAEWSRLA